MDRAEAIKQLEHTRDFNRNMAEDMERLKVEKKAVNNHYDFAEAIDMAIAALREQEQSKWISVKERLPETHKDVLVFQTNGKVLKGWLGTAKRWFAPGVVTHWMPLPEPPKEGAEG